MKVIFQKDPLVNAVSNVSRAVFSKSPIPALEGVLIKAENNKAMLTGYDLEMGIITTIAADVQEEGSLVLSARLLLDIIRRTPSDTILISSDDKNLALIKSGVSEFTILGIDPKEYPELPLIEEESTIVIQQGILKSMIDQTLFAIATLDSKPVHTGSLFDVKDSYITIVSVDGYRLALRREPLVTDAKCNFIVPGKTLSEISKLLRSEDKEVAIVVSRKHIIFRVDGYNVITRLLEGEFLDYNSAIPKETRTSIKINTRSIIDSIERTSLLITDKSRSPLKVNAINNMIQTSCSTAMGKAYDEIPCEMTGDSVSIGFNNKYLLDALKATESDKIRLEINGALSPMRILPLENENFLFLVLPVRLKNDE